MNAKKWLRQYEGRLCGKSIVLFGSTGGIGAELCRYILKLGGTLITVDRNPKKAALLRSKLKHEFENAKIINLTADLEDIESVNSVCDKLLELAVDVVVHNAGAYSIPRKICSTGLDNVFQINFFAPFFITNRLLPLLSNNKGRVVVVGSIAHNYSKTDINDIDFRKVRSSSLAYGNAKRYLMFSSLQLAKENGQISVSITHPGITFTNITAHYPKWIFMLIKNPMKVIFMPPKIAALSIVMGLFEDTGYYEWIGPKIFDVWGKPQKKKLRTAKESERLQIYKTANRLYNEIESNFKNEN